MLLVEIYDSPNRAQLEKLEANGFSHDESQDYIDLESGGCNVEVWVKDDGQRAPVYMDVGDLDS